MFAKKRDLSRSTAIDYFLRTSRLVERAQSGPRLKEKDLIDASWATHQGMVRASFIASTFGAVILFCSLFTASGALARERGLASSGCEGCHGGSTNSTLSASPLEADLGTKVTLRFTLTDPDAKVGGIFIEMDDLGKTSVASGSNLAVVSGGITHTTPRNFQNGAATFEVSYQVPSSPGATRFSVWSLAGNGDSENEGDEANEQAFDLVYGCSPQTFYRDLDGDGSGRATMPLRHCAGAPPTGFGALGDDCDDNSAERHPGATEFCNRRDDDCDGEVDENAVPVLLFPDSDGDGFYTYEEGQSLDTVTGCVPYPGYADSPGDCDPERAEVNPGATEVCDLILDEDCDGRVDERTRPICGEGWCRRESRSCSLDDCTPGDPTPEVCNFLDDDCDGVVDEGDLCPSGESCLAGECRDASLTQPPGGQTDGGTSTSSSEALGCAQGPDGRSRSGAGLLFFVLLAGALSIRRFAPRF